MKPGITNLQQELLKVFHYELNEKQLLEVKNLLSNYFAEMASSEMENLWNTNNWDEETMKKWANEHTRTPYKP